MHTFVFDAYCSIAFLTLILLLLLLGWVAENRNDCAVLGFCSRVWMRCVAMTAICVLPLWLHSYHCRSTVRGGCVCVCVCVCVCM